MSQIRLWLRGLNNTILAAALAGKADILVTGDNRHFGKMFNKKYKGVLVLTPAQALDYVLQV
jgi:predicted nucleic acid-binding protein